jgi:SSS family solute:Na+ symporter
VIKLAVIIYCIAAIGLGWASMRRGDVGAAFWTAGRQLDAASVGLSISAGFMSVSWSCVYAVQVFYAYGLGGIWLITIPWLVALYGIYRLAGHYRALSAFSQPEMVGERFGPVSRRLVACALCFVFLAWGGAEIFVAATLLAPGLDLSVDATVVTISLVVGIYATMGGFRAVVATDKLQYGIVAVYVMAMSWLALKGMLTQRNGSILPGAEVLALRSGTSWTNLWGPGLVTIALTFAAYLPGWLFETDLWVRVLAARDAKTARRGVVLAAFNAVLFVGVLPLFVGIVALELFPPVAGAGPTSIGQDGNAIFAALVAEYAPAWMTVLVAVGLVAAAMSTIDTCANVVSLAFAYDLLRVHERERTVLNVRTVTALSMLDS